MCWTWDFTINFWFIYNLYDWIFSMICYIPGILTLCWIVVLEIFDDEDCFVKIDVFVVDEENILS